MMRGQSNLLAEVEPKFSWIQSTMRRLKPEAEASSLFARAVAQAEEEIRTYLGSVALSGEKSSQEGEIVLDQMIKKLQNGSVGVDTAKDYTAAQKEQAMADMARTGLGAFYRYDDGARYLAELTVKCEGAQACIMLSLLQALDQMGSGKAGAGDREVTLDLLVPEGAQAGMFQFELLIALLCPWITNISETFSGESLLHLDPAGEHLEQEIRDIASIFSCEEIPAESTEKKKSRRNRKRR